MSSTALPRPAQTVSVRALTVVVAAAGAAVVNVAVATIAVAAGASADFPPFETPVLVAFSVLGVLVGAAGWALVRRAAARPAAVLRWLVPTVVLASLVPDVALLGSGMPGVGLLAVGALMLTHVVVAAIAVPAYRRAMPLEDALSAA